jgi:hypothetical protein
LQDCIFTPAEGCTCKPRVCCNCKLANPDATGTSCDLPCTETGIGLLVCVGFCFAADIIAPNDCGLEIVNQATCGAGGDDGPCPTTGCCTFNEGSQQRTVADDVCVETDADTCNLLSPVTVFVEGGSCDGGLLGTCVSPTPTNTPTNTPTETPTATNTATNTHTATPTNTLVPNGGDCATPAVCESTFCVDGVCCNSPCQQPGATCEDGVCTATIAEAPTLSTSGLLIAFLVLAAVGVLAMVWRRA